MSYRVHSLTKRRRLKRLLSKLPSPDEPDLIVLKGHLLLEEVLNDILSSALPRYPQAVREAKLRFPQLVLLVRGLVANPKRPWLWLALDKFNELRNDLAHRLEPKHTERLTAELAAIVAPHSGSLSDLPASRPTDKLPAIVAFLHGVLSGIDEARLRRSWR